MPDDDSSNRSVTDHGKYAECTVVIKVGTSTLLDTEVSPPNLKLSRIARIVEVIVELRRAGAHVILVASGALGSGCIKLKLKERPQDLQTKQAVASAGQSYLLRVFEDQFATLGVNISQLLLQRSDFSSRSRWCNVQDTLTALLSLGVVPIVNENDAVAPEELAKFGDNDNLAALVAVQSRADWLFLCTDVPAVFDRNPSGDKRQKARAIQICADMESLNLLDVSGGGRWGTGGMGTKLTAARTAAAAGIKCCLINGERVDIVPSLLDKWGISKSVAGTEPVESSKRRYEATHEGVNIPGLRFYPVGLPMEAYAGTYFVPMQSTRTINSLRRWIVSLPVQGRLFVDRGAAKALMNKKSLLAAGIRGYDGSFRVNESVIVCIARSRREPSPHSSPRRTPPNEGDDGDAFGAHGGLTLVKPPSRVGSLQSCLSEVSAVNSDDASVVSAPTESVLHDVGDEMAAEAPKTGDYAGMPALINSVEAADKCEAAYSVGQEIGWALCNFSSEEVRRICGKQSADYSNLLGPGRRPEVVDRDKFIPMVEQ